jgi:hypothetical protein
MNTLRRLGVSLLISVVVAIPCRADETADRLLAAFRNICLVKPDSIWAIDALAMGQGFTRDFDPSTTIKASPANPTDLFNLILFWRRGDGEGKITLNGLALDNNPLNYELLCEMNGDGVLPDDVIAALKTTAGISEPKEEKHQDSSRVTLTWKIPADPRQDVLQVNYDSGKGRQRVGLRLQQDIRTPIAK